MQHYLKVDTGPPETGHAMPDKYPTGPSAHAGATRALRALMADRLRKGKAIPSDWTVQVVDAAGQVVEVLSSEIVALEGGATRHRHRRLYDAVHHPYLMLTPDLAILEANPAYLNATMTEPGAIRHRHMFEVFPDNPGDHKANGADNLAASFRCVLRFKTPHLMPRQRYDIHRPDGTWEERYWNPMNFPLLDDNGEVEFIVHHVRDVTMEVTDRRKVANKDKTGYYAEKVRHCERAAQRMSDPELQRQMLDLAAQWRTIADAVVSRG